MLIDLLKKRKDKMDFVIISWLALKLVLDTAAFVYIIWRLTKYIS